MTSLADIFDVYSLRARIYPGLLTILPATVFSYTLIDSSPLSATAPILVSAGVIFFLASFVRGRGLVAEKALKQRWGGLPTTAALRLSTPGNNGVLRLRRREQIQRVTDVKLPSSEEEAADGEGADEIYEAAVRLLIVKVRQVADKFPRVAEENISYGFRRNLYGMRPIGVFIAVAILASSGLSIWLDGGTQGRMITLGVSALQLLLWRSVVTAEWVRQMGDRYAERLLETLEDEQLLRGGQAP